MRSHSDPGTNVDVDLTAVDAREEVRRTQAERGIVFALAGVCRTGARSSSQAGFIDRIGEDRVFMTLPTTVSAYQQWYAARRGGNAQSAGSDDDFWSAVLS